MISDKLGGFDPENEMLNIDNTDNFHVAFSAQSAAWYTSNKDTDLFALGPNVPAIAMDGTPTLLDQDLEGVDVQLRNGETRTMRIPRHVTNEDGTQEGNAELENGLMFTMNAATNEMRSVRLLLNSFVLSHYESYTILCPLCYQLLCFQDFWNFRQHFCKQKGHGSVYALGQLIYPSLYFQC